MYKATLIESYIFKVAFRGKGPNTLCKPTYALCTVVDPCFDRNSVTYFMRLTTSPYLWKEVFIYSY